MTDVFLVIHEEASFGARAYVFTDAEWALKMASRIVCQHVQSPEQVDDRLTPDMSEAGVLYHAIYNDEGDCVRVETSTLLDKKNFMYSKEH